MEIISSCYRKCAICTNLTQDFNINSFVFTTVAANIFCRMTNDGNDVLFFCIPQQFADYDYSILFIHLYLHLYCCRTCEFLLLLN